MSQSLSMYSGLVYEHECCPPLNHVGRVDAEAAPDVSPTTVPAAPTAARTLILFFISPVFLFCVPGDLPGGALCGPAPLCTTARGVVGCTCWFESFTCGFLGRQGRRGRGGQAATAG